MPYRRIPSLNWLRVFEAAARSGSFLGAARILNMSPAAVSQQVKALEGHLETKLFERGPRAVTLSDAGAAFLPVVRQSLLSIETTATSLFGQPDRASVTLQAVLIFATSWLAGRLPDFAAAHPEIELHLIGDYGEPDLLSETADLRVIHGGAPSAWGDSDRLFGETIYPVATPGLAATLRTPDDLLDHRLIEVSTHRTSWLRLFETAGIALPGGARFCFVDSSDIALALAAAGHGIGLARAPSTDSHLERLGLVRCFDEIEIESGEAYHLVCRAVATLSPAAAQVRDWLLDRARG